MEKKFSRNNIKVEYTFKPSMRIADLSDFSVLSNQGNFDIRIEGAYSDPECFNRIPSMAKVVVWGYSEGSPFSVLEKQYEKLADVSDIVNDLPENHPVVLAIWSLLDEYEARF